MIPQIFVVLNSDEKIVSHIGGRPQKKNELVHYSSEGLLRRYAGMLNNHIDSCIQFQLVPP